MKKLLLLLISLSIFSGCARIPSDLMQPSRETLKVRQEQSHTFNTTSNKQLLQASVSVLQDMGYTIKESSSDYGVLTAVKEASAKSKGQLLGAVAIAALGGTPPPIDKTQYITATIVVVDNTENERAAARTTFQRVIEKTDKSWRAEVITDQLVYREFYEKLDKSLFLEVNNA